MEAAERRTGCAAAPLKTAPRCVKASRGVEEALLWGRWDGEPGGVVCAGEFKGSALLRCAEWWCGELGVEAGGWGVGISA